MRKSNPILVHGSYELILAEHEQIYANLRTLGDDRLLVVCNVSGQQPDCALPAAITFSTAQPLIANYPVDPTQDIRSLQLRPWEAPVHRLRA